MVCLLNDLSCTFSDTSECVAKFSPSSIQCKNAKHIYRNYSKLTWSILEHIAHLQRSHILWNLFVVRAKNNKINKITGQTVSSGFHGPSILWLNHKDVRTDREGKVLKPKDATSFHKLTLLLGLQIVTVVCIHQWDFYLVTQSSLRCWMCAVPAICLSVIL